MAYKHSFRPFASASPPGASNTNLACYRIQVPSGSQHFLIITIYGNPHEDHDNFTRSNYSFNI